MNTRELAFFQLVGFGQDELIDNRCLVQHIHQFQIDVFQSVAAINQDEYPAQSRPATQEISRQFSPSRDFIFRGFGIAVTGQIDDVEAVLGGKIVEFLRPSGRIRGPSETMVIGQRVNQRGFADIGPSRKTDFRWPHWRQCVQRHRRLHKGDGPFKQKPSGLLLTARILYFCWDGFHAKGLFGRVDRIRLARDLAEEGIDRGVDLILLGDVPLLQEGQNIVPAPVEQQPGREAGQNEHE